MSIDVAVPANETPALANDAPASEVNWESMATDLETEDFGDAGVVEGDLVVPESAAETDAPPNEPASAPPAPVASEAPASVPPPSPVPAPVATPEAPPPASVAPSTPAEPQIDYAQWRSQQVAQLEEVYKFSDEMAAQLLSEPEVVLPKMAANLHMAVTETVLNSVNAMLPQVFEALTTARTRESEADTIFFGANPDLRTVDRKAILRVGQMYREVNPKASPEEAAKAIGNLVRTALGMGAPAMAANPPPAAPPATPAPFTPARGGGGGNAMPGANPSNPWASLAQEFLSED